MNYQSSIAQVNSVDPADLIILVHDLLGSGTLGTSLSGPEMSKCYSRYLVDQAPHFI